MRNMNAPVIGWIISTFLHTALGQHSPSLAQSCRTVTYAEATTPWACVQVTRKDLKSLKLKLQEGWKTPLQMSMDQQTDFDDGQDLVFNDLLKVWVKDPSEATDLINPTLADADKEFDPDLLPGACHWDAQASNNKQDACLCPAIEGTCSMKREGCYWYEIPASSVSTLIDPIPTFACINRAERFYYLLGKLLKKRGKKDFALKIRYGATPAQGQLPMGPFGPAIIGGGTGSNNMLSKALAKISQMQEKLSGMGGLFGGMGGMFGGMEASNPLGGMMGMGGLGMGGLGGMMGGYDTSSSMGMAGLMGGYGGMSPMYGQSGPYNPYQQQSQYPGHLGWNSYHHQQQPAYSVSTNSTTYPFPGQTDQQQPHYAPDQASPPAQPSYPQPPPAQPSYPQPQQAQYSPYPPQYPSPYLLQQPAYPSSPAYPSLPGMY